MAPGEEFMKEAKIMDNKDFDSHAYMMKYHLEYLMRAKKRQPKKKFSTVEIRSSIENWLKKQRSQRGDETDDQEKDEEKLTYMKITNLFSFGGADDSVILVLSMNYDYEKYKNANNGQA